MTSARGRGAVVQVPGRRAAHDLPERPGPQLGPGGQAHIGAGRGVTAGSAEQFVGDPVELDGGGVGQGPGEAARQVDPAIQTRRQVQPVRSVAVGVVAAVDVQLAGGTPHHELPPGEHPAPGVGDQQPPASRRTHRGCEGWPPRRRPRRDPTTTGRPRPPPRPSAGAPPTSPPPSPGTGTSRPADPPRRPATTRSATRTRGHTSPAAPTPPPTAPPAHPTPAARPQPPETPRATPHPKPHPHRTCVPPYRRGMTGIGLTYRRPRSAGRRGSLPGDRSGPPDGSGGTPPRSVRADPGWRRAG